MSLRPIRVLVTTVLLAPAILSAQSPKQAADQWRAAHEQQILHEFTDLLSIPNVAADQPNIQRNADALVAALQRRHVEAKQLTAADSNPVVYGEIKTPGARHTIVFYAHYDGQAVNPADWETQTPFTPVIRMVNGEPRIFGRSTSDDKAAILAQLAALDALQAAHIPIKANLRFVWEGEEEAGSTNLGAVLAKYRDQLGGDVWLICDGPVDQSGRQSVVFGARGVTHIAVTLYGPNRELHSGHYGNFAPNPAMMLAQLLGSMEDANGHVLIPHYYDGIAPLTPLEKQAIAEAPRNDAMLMREFALGRVNGGGKPLVELLNEPTLNIDGFASARTGAKANNVVPSTATADIDMRLVKGLDWKAQQQRVIDYIAAQGYFVTAAAPDNPALLTHPRVAFVYRDPVGYNAVRTPMDLPIAQSVIAAVEAARGPVVKLPTMGGSVPLEVIEHALNLHTITVPIANYDNNQHSANENLRLQNLWDGIAVMAALEAIE
ncbi:MAG TPA: M20/M25/M40 family metallo-hydrolase [Candidatus Eisenbacteria bacterium]|nr:M20/M25/M40 family metallo-hydrolase [Candidatus Eisenbacteria bacterium]